MMPYKKILATMNLTQLDTNVVTSARNLVKMGGVKEIKFFFANRNPEYRMFEDRAGLSLSEEIDQFAIRVMKDEVSPIFDELDVKISYGTIDGDPVHSILETCISDSIDLVITGRKRDTKDTGRLPIKIARKAPCQVIVVPENTSPTMSRLLVAIDFSDASILALKQAVKMAKSIGVDRIYGVHVFYLPLGYSKSGKTGVDYVKMMREEAKDKFDGLVKKLRIKDVDIRMDYMVSRRPVKMIRRIARKRGCDLILAGSKGLGSLGMLGSTTENLIQSAKCSVISVKEKGEGLSLLKKLLQSGPEKVSNMIID